MSDEMVIRCCAPTLAAIKTGSLFNCAFASRGEMTASLRAINNCLLCKGVRAIPLRYRDGRALVYLFRPDMLERDLRDPVAAGILKETGYPDENISCRISWLIRRLEESDTFPHEIGLFLGYPPRGRARIHPARGMQMHRIMEGIRKRYGSGTADLYTLQALHGSLPAAEAGGMEPVPADNPAATVFI